MRVVALELNELNVHYVEWYVKRGFLPNFASLLGELQTFQTEAESNFAHLEPWIQWPTVYSGLDYAGHKVFRLGDGAHANYAQIWEKLESEGVSVGAVSPMNAGNRCASPDFFLPDPWTMTTVTADERASALFDLIRDTVNNNAASDLSMVALGRKILPLALPHMRLRSIPRYVRALRVALKHKWAKAAFLDCLLFDLFLSLADRKNTQFATLFMNAGAHIQHHFTFDSAVYDGEHANPDWYSSAARHDSDPLLFIYSIYDSIIGQLRERKDLRVMITTGLSQVPNELPHYQYRLRNFKALLGQLDLPAFEVLPRMSRDFVLEFADVETAAVAASSLDQVRCGNEPLFRVENRGRDLFCQVAFFGPPEGLAAIAVDGDLRSLADHFVLVSIENAVHQTTGYHFDTAHPRSDDKPTTIALAEVHHRMLAAGRAAAGRAVVAGAPVAAATAPLRGAVAA